MRGNKVAIQSLHKSRGGGGALLTIPDDSFNTGRIKFLSPNCDKDLEAGLVVCFGTEREIVKIDGEELLIMDQSNIFSIIDEDLKDGEVKGQ